MWLCYHSDGTVLVHGSAAVGCHSSPPCPALPVDEYHGFNRSKKSYSIHVCLCACWSACLGFISMVIFRVRRANGTTGTQQSFVLSIEQELHEPRVNSWWSF